MQSIEYVSFTKIDPIDFLPVLNKPTTREHLVKHQVFDRQSINQWVQGKLEEDAAPGCKVRAIKIDNQLAGWCGIQCDEGKYEIAVVIDEAYWGIGKSVFLETLQWARELEHKSVYIHFLHTRPEYRFLKRLSKNIYKSEMLGSQFTTYELEVNQLIGE